MQAAAHATIHLVVDVESQRYEGVLYAEQRPVVNQTERLILRTNDRQRSISFPRILAFRVVKIEVQDDEEGVRHS